MKPISNGVQGVIMNNNQSKTPSRQRSKFESVAYLYSGKRPFSRAQIVIDVLATLTVFIAIAFVLGACTASGANDLSDTSWELASLSGSDLLPGTTITLEFTDDEASGSAGCNRYWGSYQVSGSSLTVSEPFRTEMACPEPPGVLEQEGAYLEALSDVESYKLASDQLELLDEAGGQLLVFVKPAAGSTSQVEEPPEQPDEPDTVVTQNATPTPDTEPTPSPEIVEDPPSPTPEPPLGFEPSEDATEWATLVSDAFPISLSYPADWQYIANADNSQLNLPYVRAFLEPNETLVSQDGCAINIGFGGGSGPTQTLTNDLVTIDGREFTKRTWYEGETPIFMAYLPSDIIPNFEGIRAWVSQSNETGCIQSIDGIIGSLEFTGTAGVD
jgi:heat shock protein HslJ